MQKGMQSVGLTGIATHSSAANPSVKPSSSLASQDHTGKKAIRNITGKKYQYTSRSLIKQEQTKWASFTLMVYRLKIGKT